MASMQDVGHRVSHCGRIVLFQCKSPSPNEVKEANATELIFSSFSFKRQDNNFLKESDGKAVICRNPSSDVNIVKSKSVLDVLRRVTTPCVLLRHGKKGESIMYTLLTLTNSNRLETHLEFKLPYQIKESVKILHGPTVIWSHAGTVFYTSLQAGEVKQIPIQLSHVIIGELTLYKGHVFVLGRQNSLKKCLDNKSEGADINKALCYIVENGQVFDSTLMIPDAYGSITRCVWILSSETVDGVLKTSVIAATCKKQLVYFENGVPKEVCQLPYDRPEDIQMVNLGRNGCLFVISFDQGHVCAIWKETFQVASCWSGVESVHVDDFLGCGKDQLLLVFEGQGNTGQPLDHFLITDLCGTTYSQDQGTGEIKAPDVAKETHLLTLQALESRLQSGLTILQELKRDMREKERVVLQSVHALREMVSGRQPVLSQPEQEGLIALWDDSDELSDKMQDETAVSSKLHVDKLWHRVFEDQLVVGVLLSTDSSVPVDAVSLFLLTETGPAVIQTHSQVCWLPATGVEPPSFPSTHPEPEAKRSKQDNVEKPSEVNACRLAVTTVTKLTSLLNSGCVKCPVMLHYTQRQESAALVNNPTPVVMYCGRVRLDIQDCFQTQLLKSPELKTDEVREDLLSLLAVLDRWVFHVHSPDHSLGDVDGWIQRTVGCQRLMVSPQYLLANSAGPLAAMLLQWHQTSPFQGELSVHASQLRVLQFLDSLLTFLPASCSVWPLQEAGSQDTARMLSLTLEKELLSLKEGASLLLCGQEGTSERERTLGVQLHGNTEPSSAEGLQRCRGEWEKDVEKSRMRLSPLVDVASYCKLTEGLSKIQLEGDLAALLHTQTTLFSSVTH